MSDAFATFLASVEHLRPSPRAMVCGIDALRRYYDTGIETPTDEQLGQLAQMRAEALREAQR